MNCTACEGTAESVEAFQVETGKQAHADKNIHTYFSSTAVLRQGQDLQLFCIITTAPATL